MGTPWRPSLAKLKTALSMVDGRNGRNGPCAALHAEMVESASETDPVMTQYHPTEENSAVEPTLNVVSVPCHVPVRLTDTGALGLRGRSAAYPVEPTERQSERDPAMPPVLLMVANLARATLRKYSAAAKIPARLMVNGELGQLGRTQPLLAVLVAKLIVPVIVTIQALQMAAKNVRENHLK